MLKITRKLIKHLRNAFKRDKAIDIDSPLDHDVFTYELPVVPVQKRKSKKRSKTKAAKAAKQKARRKSQ